MSPVRPVAIGYGSGPMFVLVDEDGVSREGTRAALSRSGLEVIAVGSARAAADPLGREFVHLVIVSVDAKKSVA